MSADSALWVRNPYFWRVDTAGNQLPYIDTILILIGESRSQTGALVKMIAGEIDFAGDSVGLGLRDTPLLKENEEAGDYTTYLMDNTSRTNALDFALNYTHPGSGSEGNLQRHSLPPSLFAGHRPHRNRREPHVRPDRALGRAGLTRLDRL